MVNDYHWVEMQNEFLLKDMISQNMNILKQGTHFDPVHDWIIQFYCPSYLPLFL